MKQSPEMKVRKVNINISSQFPFTCKGDKDALEINVGDGQQIVRITPVREGEIVRLTYDVLKAVS
jgi:hypothetical protein